MTRHEAVVAYLKALREADAGTGTWQAVKQAKNAVRDSGEPNDND